MRHPLVSIITVCYNAQDTIEKTINSVRKQTYDNYEYIVVDGASTDDTMLIVEQNRDIITKYISEKDDGIYYAMNKALDMATGEYVWFINAGDRIPHANTLEKIMESSYVFQDIYYGKTKIINNNGKVIAERRLKLPHNLTRYSFLWGMVVCHQSAIVRREIVGKYDTQYKISADYDWLLSAIENAHPDKMRRSRRTYSYFLAGGMSKTHMKKGNTERFKIMVKHYGIFLAVIFNVFMVFRYVRDRLTRKSMA